MPDEKNNYCSDRIKFPFPANVYVYDAPHERRRGKNDFTYSMNERK
jgi:hypothetical protein